MKKLREGKWEEQKITLNMGEGKRMFSKGEVKEKSANVEGLGTERRVLEKEIEGYKGMIKG